MIIDFNGNNGGGGGEQYVLPKASATKLGGVKVGNGLSINANGVLSADGSASTIVEFKTDDNFNTIYYDGNITTLFNAINDRSIIVKVANDGVVFYFKPVDFGEFSFTNAFAYCTIYVGIGGYAYLEHSYSATIKVDTSAQNVTVDYLRNEGGSSSPTIIELTYDEETEGYTYTGETQDLIDAIKSKNVLVNFEGTLCTPFDYFISDDDNSYYFDVINYAYDNLIVTVGVFDDEVSVSNNKFISYASSEDAGVIKVGSGLYINDEGVLSATGGGGGGTSEPSTLWYTTTSTASPKEFEEGLIWGNDAEIIETGGTDGSYWVKFDKAITKIPAQLFKNYYYLVSITIPDTVETIGAEAFYYAFTTTTLTKVFFPRNLKEIGQKAFYNYNSKSIVLPYGTDIIYEQAFASYDVTQTKRIIIPDTVSTIGDNAFRNKSNPTLLEVGAGAYLENGDKPFTGISMKKADFKNYSINDEETCSYWGVTIYDDYVDGCYIKNGHVYLNDGTVDTVNIPEGVTFIDSEVFKTNKAIYHLTCPKTLTGIGSFCFSGLRWCKDLTFKSDITVGYMGLYYAGNGLTGGNEIDITFEDCYISNTLDFSNNSKLSYASVKSILTAASKCPTTTTSTLTFNKTVTDQDGEIANLVTACTAKGWTINGLTIN